MPENTPFLSRQTIHFDMLDALGILHNAAYLQLFERARTDFWASFGLRMGEPGLDWPYYVVRNEIDYHAPIDAYGMVVVAVWIARTGRTSLTFAHEIRLPDGAVAATGQTVLVRIDPETKRPTAWSDGLRSRLAPYMAPFASGGGPE